MYSSVTKMEPVAERDEAAGFRGALCKPTLGSEDKCFLTDLSLLICIKICI